MADWADRVRARMDSIGACMDTYATRRDPSKLVGQLTDPSGRESDQFGVYSLAAWITVVNDLDKSAPKSAQAIELTRRCTEQLSQWVSASVSEELVPHSPPWELRFLVPKIAAAFDGLSRYQTAVESAQVLLKRLSDSRRSNGSWEFLTDPSEDNGNPVSTALVLQSLDHQQHLLDARRKAVEYLEGCYSRLGTVYEQLLVATTILLVGPGLAVSDHSEARRRVKRAVRAFYQQVRDNPTVAANPYTVDFPDHGRTRYVRFPTDVMVLEAFTLLSPTDLRYLRLRQGRRAAQSFLSALPRGEFRLDTVGQTQTVSALEEAVGLLRRLASVEERSNPLLTLRSAVSMASVFPVPTERLHLVLAIIASTLFVLTDDVAFKGALLAICVSEWYFAVRPVVQLFTSVED